MKQGNLYCCRFEVSPIILGNKAGPQHSNFHVGGVWKWFSKAQVLHKEVEVVVGVRIILEKKVLQQVNIIYFYINYFFNSQ